jgi:hypothetical protein
MKLKNILFCVSIASVLLGHNLSAQQGQSEVVKLLKSAEAKD